MRKMKKSSIKRLLIGAAIAAPVLAIGAPVLATHAWSTYHWAKPGAEVTAPVGYNVDPAWVPYVDRAVADWNQSTVIQSPTQAGSTKARRCGQVSGTIQVCNAAYGNTGWVGLASISLSGGHIVSGTTKLNDTYFNTATYNTPAWRQLVTCQEIGHDYGLAHQNEDFSTDLTTSCMEYTSKPEGNESPDAHDYQQLLAIYNHADPISASTGGGRPGNGKNGVEGEPTGDTPAEWGRAVGFDAQGRANEFMKVLAPGRSIITHVFWAPTERPRGN